MFDAPSSSPADRHLQILGEMAEIGLEVARRIEREARSDLAPDDQAQNDPAPGDPDQPGPPPTPCGDLALAYARVSRAVRLTLMLRSRLMEEAEHDAAVSSPAEVRKARVERIVERLVEAEHPHDEETADSLVIEAGERLDDEDLYGDLLQRPMSEIVARLCRDLGLEPDWARLAEERWAQAEIESGDVGAPLTYVRREAGRGGPLADPGESPAEGRGAEGASRKRHAPASFFSNSA